MLTRCQCSVVRCIFFVSGHNRYLEQQYTVSNPSLTMSKDNGSPERKLQIASRLIGCSEGTMKIADAMEIAGYLTPEQRGGTIYQRIRRAGQSISKKIEDDND